MDHLTVTGIDCHVVGRTVCTLKVIYDNVSQTDIGSLDTGADIADRVGLVRNTDPYLTVTIYDETGAVYTTLGLTTPYVFYAQHGLGDIHDTLTVSTGDLRWYIITSAAASGAATAIATAVISAAMTSAIAATAS